MNLYLHFPFCRRKCAYCALHSRAGSTTDGRAEYAISLADEVKRRDLRNLKTVYFGGGTPALAYLKPLFDALEGRLSSEAEFTVELHPHDVDTSLLATLKAGGVNRISMGVQSLDDAVLSDMGRGYTFEEAERAFAKIKEVFDNAGIDLIVGYPGEPFALTPRHARLGKWGLRHCSVYSLILEEKSILSGRVRRGETLLPDDDMVMNRLQLVSECLEAMGLRRYEISNYAVPGYECRHNLAVWRGEDYIGLGDGAHGREGLKRTRGVASPAGVVYETEELDDEGDLKERTIFRLRTHEGLDTSRHPHWRGKLDAFTAEKLLVREGAVYRLTPRGREVCDSILEALV